MLCNFCGKEYTMDPCPHCGHHSDEPLHAEVDASQGDSPTEQSESTDSSNQSEVDSPTEQGVFPTTESLNESANWGVYSDSAPNYEPASFAETPKPTFCTVCGTALNGANFCPQCGAATTPPPPAAQPAEQGWHTAPPPNHWGTAAPHSANPDWQDAASPNQWEAFAPHPFTARYLHALQTNPQAFQNKASGGMKAAIIIGLVFYFVVEVVGIFLSIDYYHALYSNGFGSSYGSDPANPWDDDFNWDDEFQFDDDFNLDSDSWEGDRSADEQPASADVPETMLPLAPDSVSDSGTVLYPNGISLEEYRQLAIGMTYAEVSAMIGGDGIPMMSETSASDTLDLVWIGEYNASVYVTMTFADQQLIQVKQDGLF